MALTCKQAAGNVVLNSSSLTSDKGSSISSLSVYNADASPTTFTFKFIDSSQANLEITLKRLVVNATSTATLMFPVQLILSDTDELKVSPSAGGGTHQYTFSERSNNNQFSSKAYVVTDTNLTTIKENQTDILNVNVFNNKTLLADSPVFEAFDGSFTNIFFKQSIPPLENITQAYPTLEAGDTIKARASSGSSSDFHIYAAYV